MRTSRATAVWQGNLQDGNGTFNAASGAFSGSYSAGTRFGTAAGTNPEELIAAAHAACYSMALAADLGNAGKPATRVETQAACSIDVLDGGAKITGVALSVRAKVPGLDQAAFAKVATTAKENCPVSRALKQGVPITLEAVLE